MSVGVLIEHRVRRGCRDEARAVWERLLRPAIEANDAHEVYSYMFDAEDPDVIRAFQQYSDAESASAFLNTPAYGAYVAEVEDLLFGPPQVVRADVIWTKPHKQFSTDD
jgi:quinol monooxygenase YgiN